MKVKIKKKKKNQIMTTLINLCKSFAGESQARNRYIIDAKRAKKRRIMVCVC